MRHQAAEAIVATSGTGPGRTHLLLDYLRLLAPRKAGRRAVHLQLSRLRPFNRREHHILAATEGLEPMAGSEAGQLFQLANADLIFVYKAELQPWVEREVRKVCYLFSDDPLVAEEPKHGRLAVWYDIERDYDRFLKLVRALLSGQEEEPVPGGSSSNTRARLKEKQREGDALTPDLLGKVEQALRQTDLSNLVRRQSVCSLASHRVPITHFSEIFVSIAALRETVLPNVNLAANRWLFQHLTETLDRRVLNLLAKPERAIGGEDLSLNLNLSTILSEDFHRFDRSLPAARVGSLIVELQPVDVFSDPGRYMVARDLLKDKGYRLCLDGLTPTDLQLYDPVRLGVDFVKVIWDQAVLARKAEVHARLAAVLRRMGRCQAVLCRIDAAEGVEFGRSLGIGLFQGRYVERLVSEDRRRRQLLRLKRPANDGT